jgi:hypothetical protein
MSLQVSLGGGKGVNMGVGWGWGSGWQKRGFLGEVVFSKRTGGAMRRNRSSSLWKSYIPLPEK